MEGIVAPREGIVKARVVERVLVLVEELFATDPEDEYAAERAVWSVLLEIGRLLLTALLARRCWSLARQDLAERGLSMRDVRFRLDADYWAVLKTTLGRIEVPRFAYRHKTAGGLVTHTPSRSALPLHPHCRSSTLLLRWETLLGAQTTFRNAEDLLRVLSHGAVRLHDTTLASHCEVVASLVERGWLYKTPCEIRELLETRAVRDEATGKPLLFFSSDAHAERVYDGESWATTYRMFNGIRLWCMDESKGRAIPLGGEFLVGDCHAVSDAFVDLIARGILPADGDYGGGLVAQLVFVADGMPWFDDLIVPHFPGAEVVLDAYHVLEKLAQTLGKLFGTGSRAAKRTYNQLCRWVTGRAPRENRPRCRTGTPKRKAPKAPYTKHRAFPSYDPASLEAKGLPGHSGGALLAALAELKVDEDSAAQAALAGFVAYLSARINRIRYEEFWWRGFLISSAPMESFNRVAQHRIKRPGTTWTLDMAQAILNLRVMSVIGNDERFWADAGVRRAVAHAFKHRSAA